MNNIIIRKAENKDAQNMLNYMNKLLKESDLSLPMQEDEFETTLEDEIRIIERYLKSKTSIFLIAEYNNEIVGILNTTSNRLRANQHDISFGMSVSKKYRRNKIGEMLLKYLINWANENKEIKSINLIVWKNNLPAITLYKKYGFEYCGERKYSTIKNGEYESTIIMELFLKNA